LLPPEDWAKERFPLLRFVRRHLDRRGADAGWQRLLALRPEALAAPGTAMAVARTAGGMAVGVAFAAEFGEDALVVAVHPALRGRGIGRELLGRLASEWERLAGRPTAGAPSGGEEPGGSEAVPSRAFRRTAASSALYRR
jgi:GNAT superfamily N-acetyltransferase